MTRAFKNLALGCASAALLLGATAFSANAYYLGYGNGDPGAWDFWTEQAGGPAQWAAIEAQEKEWEAAYGYRAYGAPVAAAPRVHYRHSHIYGTRGGYPYR